MKYFVSFITLVSVWFISFANDLIVLRSGDIINAKVLEVGKDEIKYKKTSNISGPTYTMEIVDILSISYENGTVDKFDNIVAKNPDEAYDAKYKEPITDIENEKIIAEANVVLYPSDYIPKKKIAKKGVPVMWICEGSIMSTDDISMRIVGALCPSKHDLIVMRYYIEVNNKSRHTIYVDKSQSFRIDNNGVAKSLYDNRIINVSKGSGTNLGIGLGSVAGALGIGGIAGNIAGGISVGGEKSHGTGTSYSDERFLIIPAGAKAYISEHKYESDHWQLISDAETFMYDVKSIQLHDGELREYNEVSSPYKVHYEISFSKDPMFKVYSSLKAGLYAKYMVGKSVQYSFWNHLPSNPEGFRNNKDAFKQYSNAVPNFESVFGKIIVGRDYRED